MSALLYADWCTIKNVMARYLGICLVVVVPVVVMSNEGGSDAPGVFAASMFTVMLLFYVMLSVFSADETAAWEQMRLTLPVTTRTVVRERYAFLVLAAFALATVGSALGVATNVVLSALGMLTVPRGVVEVLGGAFGTAAFGLGYLALVIPYVFKVGMGKARITFSLPFIACMALNVGPVRDAFLGVLNWLEATSAALGSPLPLLAAGLALIVAVYLVSMLVSERLYAARDF